MYPVDDEELYDEEIDRAEDEDELDDFSDLPDDDEELDDGEEDIDDGESGEGLDDEAARADLIDLFDDYEVFRTLGHDITPGHDELHHYWTKGEGLAKWAESPKPWTTLVALLTRHVGLRKAKIYASRWFIETFGYAAGSDLNRVTHGHPPRGHRVGPG